MTIAFGAFTHVGMKRDHNEDAYLAHPEQRVFFVCDGMGGHASGEVASRLACDEIREFFDLGSVDREATWPFKMDRARTYEENRLSMAVKAANLAVYERSQSDPRCRGMGTTAVGLYFPESETKAIVAHAGDSRCYRLRRGRLERLTVDHSLVEEYVRMGRLTEEEAKVSPQKNIILRALGQQRTIEVEVRVLEPEDGDLFLLCSDGLSGMIEDEDIARLMQAYEGDLNACARALVDAANAAGGLDNITCVLARWSRG